MFKSASASKSTAFRKGLATLAFAAVALTSGIGVAAPASAALLETFSYSLGADGNVTILDCDGDCPTSFEIPSTHLGHPVTAIGSYAFAGQSITSVTLPDSIVSIGAGAFTGNALSSLTLSSSLTSIGSAAFRNNQLTSVDLPFSLTSIGDYAFENNQLASVRIPPFVTAIGEAAFSTNELVSVAIPNSVTSIGTTAFAYNRLTSVVFPPSVTSIGLGAFYSNSLEAVSFQGDSPTDGTIIFGENPLLSFVDVSSTTMGWESTFSGVNVRVDGWTFSYTTDTDNNVTVTGCDPACPTDLVIPSTLGGNPVTAVANNAFMSQSLTSVTFPDSLSSIGDAAFASNSLTSLTLPSSLLSIGDGAFGTNSLTSLTLPDSLTSIGTGAFGNNSLASLTLSSSLTGIGASAFSYNQLTSLSIPSSVMIISDSAFSYNQLTSLSIPSSVIIIGEGAFSDNQLTSLSIPSSVSSIGLGAFASNWLTSVTFDGAAPTDGGFVFGGNVSLPAVDVAYGSTGWGSTFSGVSVRVGEAPFTYTTDGDNNVTITGYNGTVPADLVIPATLGGNPVTAIADNAFKGMGLTSVIFPDSLLSIGAWAFENNSLSSVTLPTSLTTLNTGAFYINSLTSVTVPASVTTIGDWTFATNALTAVTFEGNAPEVGSNVFYNDSDLNAVDVAYGSTGWGATFSDVNVRVGDAPLTYSTDADNNVTVTGCIGTCSVDLEIPATLGGNPVTAIADNAFKGMGLTSVTFPDSLLSIGAWAFENNSLTSVTIPTSLTTLNTGAFYINSLTSVTVPASVTTIGDWTFAGNYDLTSVTLEGNAPTVGSNVFYADMMLPAVDVSSSTTGWGATFAEVPVRVDGLAFTYTTDADNNVTITGCLGTCPADLIIPSTLWGNQVTAIGNWAFAGKSLTSITLPDSLLSIGNLAFFSNSLTTLTLPSSLTSIGEEAFGRNDITALSIPSSVTSISDYAFNRNLIASLELPSTLTSIGMGAFQSNLLTSLTIPASVTSIGDSAFADNASLALVTFVGNAPTAGTDVFSGASELANVRVPYGTTGWEATFAGTSVVVVGAPKGTPASAPSIRTVKSGNGRVTLGFWAPRKNGGSDITGYEYTVDDGVTWTAVDPAGTGAKSLVVAGLTNGTRYTIKVRAVNANGGGAASNAKAFTPRTVASAPNNLVLSVRSGRIKVDFDAPTNNGGATITRYGYSVNGGTWYNFGASTSPQWIKGLKNGQTYSIRIKALNAAGWSAASDPVEATPQK